MNSREFHTRISHKNYIQNDMPAEIPEKIQEKTKFSEIPPSESPEVPPEPSPEENRKGINQIFERNCTPHCLASNPRQLLISTTQI